MALSKIKQVLPVILSITSVAGLAATTILAIKATPKATELLKTEETQKGEKLTKKEIVKVVWKNYIPTAAAFVGTASCIIGAAILSKKQQASLASAYALVSASYNKYKNKVKELFGEEAHEKVVSSIAAEKAKDVTITAATWFTNTTLDFGDDDEEHLFYDISGDTYFHSTVSKVLQAEYHINRNYVLAGAVSLNDFYDLLGLEHKEGGDAIGWSCEDGEINWLDFNNSKTVTDDGLEIYIIEPVFSAIEIYSDEVLSCAGSVGNFGEVSAAG